MELVAREELKRRLDRRYKTTYVEKKSYYKPTTTLPKKLKHNSFDGGEHATTYMSSKF